MDLGEDADLSEDPWEDHSVDLSLELLPSEEATLGAMDTLSSPPPEVTTRRTTPPPLPLPLLHPHLHLHPLPRLLLLLLPLPLSPHLHLLPRPRPHLRPHLRLPEDSNKLFKCENLK